MRILLIDDNQELRNFLALSLAESDVSVAEAGSGAEAIQKADEERFDGIVLDSTLGDEDGLGLLTQIRQTSNSRTPVLVMSEISTALARRVAQNAGCDQFLVKPFGAQQFTETVRALERAKR